jgi:uncharacterized protein
MSQRLPQRTDLLAMADAGRMLKGQIEVASLDRVLPLLHGTEGVLQVVMQIDTDPDGTRYVAGTIEGRIQLLCQRCLEPVAWPLNLAFRLGLVRDQEEASRLTPRYEPLIVTAEPTRLADVVADEVLLAMPQVPVHPEQEACLAPQTGTDSPEEIQRENPFAVLAKLKDHL